MGSNIIYVFLIQFGIVAVFIFLIMIIIHELHMSKLEKRFEPFCLATNAKDEISIFDKFLLLGEKIVWRLSSFLNNFDICKNYAKQYERFITYDENIEKKGIDFIALKLLVGLIFILLKIFMSLFHLTKINLLGFIFPFLLGFFLPDVFLYLEFYKRKKQIETDLLKAIIMMNNAFRAGRNIMQAIESVKNELDGPIANEFKKIYLDISYGLSLEIVFARFYERVKIEDAKYIVTSLSLLNKTGGNITHLFSSIEKSIIDKKKLQNELKSLTAASIFVYRFLIALPFIFIIVIYILNPTYFQPLFKTRIGSLFLILIIMLYSLYIFIIKKVLKVKME